MVEMANWNIEKDIKDFLYFEEFGNNKSPNTIKSMKKDLFQLAEYLNEIEYTIYKKFSFKTFLLYLCYCLNEQFEENLNNHLIGN